MFSYENLLSVCNYPTVFGEIFLICTENLVKAKIWEKVLADGTLVSRRLFLWMPPDFVKKKDPGDLPRKSSQSAVPVSPPL
jgi:hypothetical protein